jgi:cation diffusion facilitator family transporter
MASDALIAQREKTLVALASVAGAIFLTALKLITGLVTGSLGILAEAAHSGLDLAAAILTFLAVRVSARPPDEDHHYGHGRVENISALGETLLLLITCLWIGYEAIQRLSFKTVKVEANLYSFGVMIVSIVVDIALSRALYRVARKHHSQALEADALHYSSDILSSGVVLMGLLFVRWGYPLTDSLAALAVAGLVAWASIRLGKQSVDVLVDRAPAGASHQVREAVLQVDGVLDCRQVRVRRSGPDFFVDLTIDTAPMMGLEAAHGLASAVEQRVKTVLPDADVVVHVEPAVQQELAPVQRVRAVANRLGLNVHDVRVHEVQGRLYVDIHLELDPHMKLQAAHDLTSRLEADIAAELPNTASISTHLEPAEAEALPGRYLPDARHLIIYELERVTGELPELLEWHKLEVREVDGKLFVSLHGVFAADASLKSTHNIASRLETILKERMPEVEQVLVHAEPASE